MMIVYSDSVEMFDNLLKILILDSAIEIISIATMDAHH